MPFPPFQDTLGGILNTAGIIDLNGSAINQTDFNTQASEPTLLVWGLLTTFNIVFMQTGFALLEAGIARADSVKTILLKNLLDMSATVLIWWLFGFAFAELNSGYLALSLRSDPSSYVQFLSGLSFCSTAVTIVSGGILGRMELYGYLVYSVGMVVLIYAPVSWSAWNENGFLFQLGFLDFAGSGVVHVTGGVAALVGAVVIGPRANRFQVDADGIVTIRNFGKHSSLLSVTGVWILVFGCVVLLPQGKVNCSSTTRGFV